MSKCPRCGIDNGPLYEEGEHCIKCSTIIGQEHVITELRRSFETAKRNHETTLADLLKEHKEAGDLRVVAADMGDALEWCLSMMPSPCDV